jgi:hypothetical protein
MSPSLQGPSRTPVGLAVLAWLVLTEIAFWTILDVLMGGPSMNVLGRILLANCVLIMGLAYSRAIGRPSTRGRLIAGAVAMGVFTCMVIWAAFNNSARHPYNTSDIVCALMITLAITFPMAWFYAKPPLPFVQKSTSKDESLIGATKKSP